MKSKCRHKNCKITEYFSYQSDAKIVNGKFTRGHDSEPHFARCDIRCLDCDYIMTYYEKFLPKWLIEYHKTER